MRSANASAARQELGSAWVGRVSGRRTFCQEEQSPGFLSVVERIEVFFARFMNSIPGQFDWTPGDLPVPPDGYIIRRASIAESCWTA
jgi:hypothetical protein